MRDAVHTAGFFAPKALSGVKILDLAGELSRQVRRVKAGDTGNARPPSFERLPDTRDIVPDWRNGPHASNYHSLKHASSSSSKVRVLNKTLTRNYNTGKGRKMRRESVEKHSLLADSPFLGCSALFFGLFGKKGR
jgi:hypothetical protein